MQKCYLYNNLTNEQQVGAGWPGCCACRRAAGQEGAVPEGRPSQPGPLRLPRASAYSHTGPCAKHTPGAGAWHPPAAGHLAATPPVQVSVYPAPDWSNATFFTDIFEAYDPTDRASFQAFEDSATLTAQHPSNCPAGCSGRGLCSREALEVDGEHVEVSRCLCVQVWARPPLHSAAPEGFCAARAVKGAGGAGLRRLRLGLLLVAAGQERCCCMLPGRAAQKASFLAGCRCARLGLSPACPPACPPAFHLQGYSGDGCERTDATHCLAGCSGRGECVRGFCHCRPPFYGTGCLKGRPAAGKAQGQAQGQGQQRHPDRSKLKVYMYDLPWQLAFQDGYYPGGPTSLPSRTATSGCHGWRPTSAGLCAGGGGEEAGWRGTSASASSLLPALAGVPVALRCCPCCRPCCKQPVRASAQATSRWPPPWTPCSPAP
jgi:hypothetical protein